MSNKKSLFEQYIEWAGGFEKAANALACTSQYLYLIRKGRKPMTAMLAKSIHNHSGGRFDRSKLLWGEK